MSNVDDDLADGAECPFCDGAGGFEGDDDDCDSTMCEKCDGTGRMSDEKLGAGTRIGYDDDGTIDDVSLKVTTSVYAEMMDLDEMLILVDRADGRTSRLSVCAKRGRWPWSAPVLASSYEDDY